MRGRLWVLWSTQTLEGVLCIFMGLSKDNLGATIAFMVFFSICVQASEGASYGVVPFISRRALGVVSGFIGAGGNAGATISTAAFFTKDSIETYEGLQYLGYTVHRRDRARHDDSLPDVGFHVFPGFQGRHGRGLLHPR